MLCWLFSTTITNPLGWSWALLGTDVAHQCDAYQGALYLLKEQVLLQILAAIPTLTYDSGTVLLRLLPHFNPCYPRPQVASQLYNFRYPDKVQK